MPKIIATGGGTDEELKQNPLKALWEKFASLDKFSKTLVMTTVLFLVFASAITTLTLSLRNYADTSQGSSFNWNIGNTTAQASGVYMQIGDKKYLLSMGKPSFNGFSTQTSDGYRANLNFYWYENDKDMKGNILVDYKKDGSWIIKEIKVDEGNSGNWISFNAVSNGQPIQGGTSYVGGNLEFMSGANKVHIDSLVLNNFSTLLSFIAPVIHPISWNTNEASLLADNFYVQIDGKKYYATLSAATSSPIHQSDGYYLTDIQNTLVSDNVSQPGNSVLLRLDFQYRNGEFWRQYLARVGISGQWRYFNHNDEFNQSVQHELGQSYINTTLDLYGYTADGARDLNSKIHFENIKLTPFKTLIPTRTPTPTSSPFYLKVGAINDEPGGKFVTLSWSSVSGTLKYNLYQRNSKNTPYGAAILGTSSLSADIKINGTLSNYFKVDACSTTSCISSNEVYVAPQITPTPGYSYSATFFPTADAYVRSDLPNKNYGKEATIRADKTPRFNSYLKFDLRSLSGKLVTNATFIMKAINSNAASSNGNQNIKKASSNNWAESSITYKNAPSIGAVQSTIKKVIKNNYVYFDLTKWVLANQGKIATITLQTDSNDNAIFYSREDLNNLNWPTLNVYFEPTPTPTQYVTPTNYYTPTPTSIYPTRTSTPTKYPTPTPH